MRGRYVWQRITFLHSKTQAVTIGRKQFKDLCVATGISEQVTDVEVFKFIPCRDQGWHRDRTSRASTPTRTRCRASAARAQGSNAGQGYAEAGSRGRRLQQRRPQRRQHRSLPPLQRQRHHAALAQAEADARRGNRRQDSVLSTMTTALT